MNTTISVYRAWAPVVGRVLIAGIFIMAATMKIPGTASFAGEVGYTTQYGVPFASLAVILALIFELGCGLALLAGYRTRLAAFVLALLTALFALVFHSKLSDPSQMGQFVMHLGLIGGLLYISAFGAPRYALSKDAAQ